LTARAWFLCGVTTDGAALSPAPRVEGCGEVPQPLWTLHLMAERGQAVFGAVARAWQLPTPPCVAGARARQRPRRPPAGTSGWQRHAPRWSPPALGASSVTCTKPHGSPWGAAAVGAPSDRRCGRAWSRS